MIYHKFNAKATSEDNIRFASKKEAIYYNELKLRVRAGEVVFFLRQVPFDIPAGVHRIDFVEFLSNGEVEFIEVKGYDTPMGKLKRKQVEELYPIKIKVV